MPTFLKVILLSYAHSHEPEIQATKEGIEAIDMEAGKESRLNFRKFWFTFFSEHTLH